MKECSSSIISSGCKLINKTHGHKQETLWANLALLHICSTSCSNILRIKTLVSDEETLPPIALPPPLWLPDSLTKVSCVRWRNSFIPLPPPFWLSDSLTLTRLSDQSLACQMKKLFYSSSSSSLAIWLSDRGSPLWLKSLVSNEEMLPPVLLSPLWPSSQLEHAKENLSSHSSRD